MHRQRVKQHTHFYDQSFCFSAITELKNDRPSVISRWCFHAWVLSKNGGRCISLFCGVTRFVVSRPPMCRPGATSRGSAALCYLMFLVVMQLSPCRRVVASPCPCMNTNERDALMMLFDATAGTTWTRSQAWSRTAFSMCGWYGLGCGPDGRVMSISLASNNLSGTIPPVAVATLQGLTSIDLSSNNPPGPLPDAWGGSLSLRVLGFAQ